MKALQRKYWSRQNDQLYTTTTRAHTRLTAHFPGLPGWAGTRKAKPIWISLKQETVSGSGISWNICKSAPHSRHITTPAPHHSVFYRRMPILPPNQQCQALKAFIHNNNAHNKVIETQARRIYRYHRAEGGVPRTTGCDHSTRPAAPNNTLPVTSDICTTKTTGLLKHKGAQPCLSVKPSHFPLIRPLWGTTHKHTHKPV